MYALASFVFFEAFELNCIEGDEVSVVERGRKKGRGKKGAKEKKTSLAPKTALLVFEDPDLSLNISCLFLRNALDFGKVRLRHLLDALVDGRQDGAAGVDAGRRRRGAVEGSGSGHGKVSFADGVFRTPSEDRER